MAVPNPTQIPSLDYTLREGRKVFQVVAGVDKRMKEAAQETATIFGSVDDPIEAMQASLSATKVEIQALDVRSTYRSMPSYAHIMRLLDHYSESSDEAREILQGVCGLDPRMRPPDITPDWE